MINLKLAQHNEEGKFEKFLELGKGFAYLGDYIGITGFECDEIIASNWFRQEDRINWNQQDFMMSLLFKDEKDPFNRFDGLFDGITYGEGRFVLITEGFEDFYQVVECQTRATDKFYGYLGNAREAPFELEYKVVGNLIENPELWSKIK